MSVNKRSLLLVAGYMREGESIIDNTSINIIPVSLIQICYKFYLNSISKFIQYSNKKMDFDTDPASIRNEFVSLNINNKTMDTKNIITIGSNTEKISMDRLCVTTSPYCYIPNISWSVPSPHLLCKNTTNYDGILGLYSNNKHFDYRPCLILFNSSEIGNEQHTNIYFETFLSNVPFPSCTKSKQYIYCGPKYGIISEESDGKLYQLKLRDISSKNYRFSPLLNRNNRNHDIDYDYNEYNEYNDEYKEEYDCFPELMWDLKMTYLRRTESIFAINSENYNMSMHKTKCGLFDFNYNEWRFISNEKFINIKSDECGICGDWNEQNIYLVSTAKLIGKYDILKEKWFIFNNKDKNELNDKPYYNMIPTIWFDNDHINNLYCMGQINGKNLNGGKLELRCFDIRDNKQDWKLINMVQQYHDIKFCNNIF